MQRFKYILGIMLLAGLWSCKKDKSDALYIEQPFPPPLTASTTRIMNVGVKWTELFVDSVQLTSMTSANSEGFYLDANTKPSIYFQNGRVSTTYAIPQKFIRQDGTATVTYGSLIPGAGTLTGGIASLAASRTFNIKEDVNNPLDYYLVIWGPHGNPGDMIYDDSLFAVHRSISPPANPQNFKIRILNLSSGPDQSGNTGDMSLTYADGTPVSTTTSNVQPGVASGYVEVPYGTFQFKVLTADGRLVPAVANGDEGLNAIDAPTGTFQVGANPPVSTHFGYAPIHTYQPGGVYTILISANNDYTYTPPGSNSGNHVSINTFRMIADITEPQNLSYARVQAVNALPGTGITATVDGKPLQENPVTFTSASAYQTYITGSHELEIKDASGASLGKQTISMQGGNNFSAWVYPDASGKPAVKVIANNLSGSFYKNPANTGDNGAYDQYTITEPFNIRFLNLSTDVPEITMTDGNGQPIPGYIISAASATQHLTQGEVVTDQPYAQFYTLAGLSALKVYASKSNIVPGDWLSGVATLPGTAFIANPALYTAQGTLPGYECGIYTVALVGTLNPKDAGDQKAKLMVIKHNK